ncbi:beta-galactosidase, partial [Eubacteriales bacterium OttesenSCG-928-G02]|nr:beta-galactosidase [Eubacteriales bacterium OttesenSCG-928-G02]
CPDYYSRGCSYTRCTGIWQTVWLENVPELWIKNLKLTPDVDNSKLKIEAKLSGYVSEEDVVCTAFKDGKTVAVCKSKHSGDYINTEIHIENPMLWNVLSPEIYDLEIKICNDTVKSYFGMRKININGKKIEINGKSVFQRLVLDQQYFPDGIYTAKDDQTLKNDVMLGIEAGFNGARMHMKVFEPRFLYWADMLGYIIWGEYPNWGIDDSNDLLLSVILPEWMEAMERDYNHPALIGWCPLNETSTNRSAVLHETLYKATKAIDPYRPCIDTSGYVHAGYTDVYDVHDYEFDPEIIKNRYKPLNDGTPNNEIFANFKDVSGLYNGQPYFISEFGGLLYDMEKDIQAWGYGKSPESEEEYMQRYEKVTAAILDNPGICAFCYTQLTDVEQEKNGVYTYNREKKFDMTRIRNANMRKAAIED